MSQDDLTAKFREFDKDGNGTVSLDEAHTVLSRDLGYRRDMTEKLVKLHDTNKDGRLSYEEFISFYRKVNERKKDLEVAFRKMDADGSNSISLQEAKVGLQGLGLDVKEIENLFHLHDKNDDGKLDFDEFRTFWNS